MVGQMQQEKSALNAQYMDKQGKAQRRLSLKRMVTTWLVASEEVGKQDMPQRMAMPCSPPFLSGR